MQNGFGALPRTEGFEHRTRRAGPTDLPAVGYALGAAVHDDPVLAWIVPDEARRRARLAPLMELFAGRFQPHVLRADVRHVAAAGVTPVGRSPEPYAGGMTVKVELAGLGERIDELGPGAFLVTVGEDGRPHVVSVQVDREGERLTMPAGRTTRANLAARPVATLLWPAPAGGDYSLLVDGTAAGEAPGEAPGDGPVTIVPASAILHRVAGAGGSGPTCLPVTP